MLTISKTYSGMQALPLSATDMFPSVQLCRSSYYDDSLYDHYTPLFSK